MFQSFKFVFTQNDSLTVRNGFESKRQAYKLRGHSVSDTREERPRSRRVTYSNVMPTYHRNNKPPLVSYNSSLFLIYYRTR